MKKVIVLLCAMVITVSLSAQEFKGDFTNIKASFVYVVQVVKADNCSVRMECPEEMKEYVDVRIERGVLKLTQTSSSSKNRVKIRNMKVMVYVTMPILERLDISGAASIRFTNSDSFDSDYLNISLSGASLVKGGTLEYGDANISMSGASKIIGLKLNCKKDVTLEMSGASKIDHSDFKYKYANLGMSGSSLIKVGMVGESAINVEMSGASMIEVKGSVEHMELEMSGASRFVGAEFIVQEGRLDLSGASRARTNIEGEFKLDKSGASANRNGVVSEHDKRKRSSHTRN